MAAVDHTDRRKLTPEQNAAYGRRLSFASLLLSTSALRVLSLVFIGKEMADHQGRKGMESRDVPFNPPTGPVLCRNGCGFFGSADTGMMCSKCFKETVLKQSKQKESTAVDTEKAAEAPKTMDVDVTKSRVEQEESGAVARLLDQGGASERPQESTPSASGQAPEQQKPANRCASCKKRVGLTGFKCRCGDTFCSQHRYSDRHECRFDYRKLGQDAIAKANPLVVGSKVDRI